MTDNNTGDGERVNYDPVDEDVSETLPGNASAGEYVGEWPFKKVKSIPMLFRQCAPTAYALYTT